MALVRLLILIGLCSAIKKIRFRPYVGQDNETRTSVVMLKQFKVGSETLQSTVYGTLGVEHAHVEHVSLHVYAVGGLAALSCCLQPFMAPRRVVFAVLFREPRQRLVSALNMVMQARRRNTALPCAERSAMWFEAELAWARRAHSTEAWRFFLASTPYSQTFGVTTLADVERAVSTIREDFIVGTTDRIAEFISLLSRVISVAEAKYVNFTSNRGKDGHVAKAYCTVESLPLSVQRLLVNLTVTDGAIYQGVSHIFEMQLSSEPARLPSRIMHPCTMPRFMCRLNCSAETISRTEGHCTAPTSTCRDQVGDAACAPH